MGAVGLALISYNSAMVTARGFAAKNRYDIDPNQEFIALGVAEHRSGASPGLRCQWGRLAHRRERLGRRQEPGHGPGRGRCCWL